MVWIVDSKSRRFEVWTPRFETKDSGSEKLLFCLWVPVVQQLQLASLRHSASFLPPVSLLALWRLGRFRPHHRRSLLHLPKRIPPLPFSAAPAGSAVEAGGGPEGGPFRTTSSCRAPLVREEDLQDNIKTICFCYHGSLPKITPMTPSCSIQRKPRNASPASAVQKHDALLRHH